MINHLMGKFLTVACLAAFLYILTGCNEATILGQDLIPGSDHVSTQQTDTFTVRTATVYRPTDSVVTSFQSQVAAGAINSDPVFGKTVTIPYAQFALYNPGFTYSGTGVKLDSVVLSMAYAGYYGDSMGTQSFTVYPVNDPTFDDTTFYYAHQQLPLNLIRPLGSVTASHNGIKDSVNNYGVMEAPQLRVRLSDAFGNSLLQQKEDEAFASDSAFHAFLNGLALVPDSTTGGKNSLLFFQMNSPYTGITVYYHNETDDSLQAFFPFNINTCAVTNYWSRDYQGAEAAQHFGDTASATGDSVIYLQDKPGLWANVDLPYLKNFPNAVINKAELIMTQIPDAASGVFQPPAYLFLWQYTDAARDTLGYVYDMGAVYSQLYGWQFTNLGYFDGGGRMITRDDGLQVVRYRINITRFLQHLINANPTYNETNYGFRLGVYDASGSTRDIGRVVIGGGTHSKYGLKLHVVYTKIK